MDLSRQCLANRFGPDCEHTHFCVDGHANPLTVIKSNNSRWSLDAFLCFEKKEMKEKERERDVVVIRPQGRRGKMGVSFLRPFKELQVFEAPQLGPPLGSEMIFWLGTTVGRNAIQIIFLIRSLRNPKMIGLIICKFYARKYWTAEVVDWFVSNGMKLVGECVVPVYGDERWPWTLFGAVEIPPTPAATCPPTCLLPGATFRPKGLVGKSNARSSISGVCSFDLCHSFVGCWNVGFVVFFSSEKIPPISLWFSPFGWVDGESCWRRGPHMVIDDGRLFRFWAIFRRKKMNEEICCNSTTGC